MGKKKVKRWVDGSSRWWGEKKNLKVWDEGQKKKNQRKKKSVPVHKCTLLFLPFSFYVYHGPLFMLRLIKNSSFLNSRNLKRCFYPKEIKDFQYTVNGV